MSRFDLVIFDNDGVLVDSEPVANRVLSALLTEYGVPTTIAECMARYLGQSVPQVRARVEAEIGRSLPDDLEERYARELYPSFLSSLEPVEGIGDALAAIRVPVCVASGGTHERIRLTLTCTGLWDRFGGRVFSAQDVARGKPAPDLFLHAAAAMGMDPRRCAVIEDSAAGITGANAAGMTTFGFAGLVPPETLAHATGGVFTRMADLPHLLGVAG